MRNAIVSILSAACFVGIGCDNSNDSGAKKAQSNSPAAAAAHSSDAPAIPPVTPPPIDPANPPASSGPGTPTLVLPSTQPAEQTAAIQGQIDQAVAYVKEKKFDLAEKVLDRLDQETTNWSTATRQTYDPKIDMARKALNAAKSGSGALDQLKGTAFPSK